MKKLFVVFMVVVPVCSWAALSVIDEHEAKAVLASVTVPVKVGIAAGQIQAPLPKEVWVAESGSTVRESIIAWAGKKQGWRVEWDAKTDFEIKAPLRFEGSIDEAAAQLIRLYKNAPKPLDVQISIRQKYIYVTNGN